jgi:hypothetical protein
LTCAFAERIRVVTVLATADKLDPTPAMKLFESPAAIEREPTDFLTGATTESRRPRGRR